jgi:hypothetical protein
VFADGAELHIVHPEQAADFEMLIDVMPVQGRERITMAPIDICEVKIFPISSRGSVSSVEPRMNVTFSGGTPIRSR